MNPRAQKVIFYTLVALLLGVTAVASDKRVPEELRALTERPSDTVDAERVRIWIPAEGASLCRSMATIHDSTGRPVIRLLDGLLNTGYYNFYWDKRDSIGAFVAPGFYAYQTEVCGKKRTGRLEVVYVAGERDFTVSIYDSVRPPVFVIRVLADSIRMSGETEFGHGRQADVPFYDTLLTEGEHRIPWEPKMSLPPGKYTAKFKVASFVRTIGFTLAP